MKNSLKPYILLLPAMSVIFGIFMSGLLMAFIQSLGYFKVIGLEDFTLKYYIEIIQNKNFLNSLQFSLYVSLISSIGAVIFGVLLAYALLRNKHKKGIEGMLYKLPIVAPHVVAALLVYNLLSQSGILPRLLYFLGFIDKQEVFPSLVFDSHGMGIIIAYLWKEIPYVALMVYTILGNIDNKLSEVALNLGANDKQVFWHILLPLSLPTITSTFITIFAFSFGAFEVPYLLGPTNPKSLPVLAYLEYTNPDYTNRPYAMVINMILTFFSMALIGLYYQSIKIIEKYNR